MKRKLVSGKYFILFCKYLLFYIPIIYWVDITWVRSNREETHIIIKCVFLIANNSEVSKKNVFLFILDELITRNNIW